MSGLGARRRHLRAMVGCETVLAGALGGAVLRAVLTQTLVTVLSGVFDPPPTNIIVPWSYLIALSSLLVVCLAVVTVAAVHQASGDLPRIIRWL